MIDNLPAAAQLIIVVLAVARVTVLVIDDAILERPRGRFLAFTHNRSPDGYLQFMLTCQRCSGFWISLVWSLSWLRWPNGTTLAATPWAVAMLAWWAGGSWLSTSED